MKVKGWKLDRADRARLLERFPPVWPEVIADHVTLMSPKAKQTASATSCQGEVIGHVNDGQGLQALVVQIGGTTVRPDGSTYHITWSIDRKRGRKPVESNAVLARLGWEPLDRRIAITLIPASWP
jgi:hypothetical protein